MSDEPSDLRSLILAHGADWYGPRWKNLVNPEHLAAEVEHEVAHHSDDARSCIAHNLWCNGVYSGHAGCRIDDEDNDADCENGCEVRQQRLLSIADQLISATQPDSKPEEAKTNE